MKQEKIEYKDLNWVCKVGVIGGWLALVIYSIAFIIGFIEGLLLI